MKTTRRRSILAVLAIVAVAMGLLLPASASASDQPATSASLTMTSDPGDYIGQGLSYAYSTNAGDSFSTTVLDSGNGVRVAVDAATGDWWDLFFNAPAGEQLAPGNYTGATRAPGENGSPGLDVFGNGRGCNTLTGSFTVTNVSFGGPDNVYLESFDASFEQHCEGADPALRGEIHIANPPAPPGLQLGLSIAPDGTVSTLNGRATVHGTVTCNEPVTVWVSGTVTEVVKRYLVAGNFSTSLACTPGTAAAWQATATPSGSVAFQKGDAQVEATAYAADPIYGVNVSVQQTATVRLKKV